MSDKNRISAVLAAADKTAIITSVEAITAKLPFLVSLTPDERKQLPKIGEKTAGFDDKCRRYMEQNPTLVPGFVDMDEFTKDCTLLDQLKDVATKLDAVASNVDDSVLLVGSEVYNAELAFYQNVAQAAKRDVPGAQTIYDDLKSRFPGAPHAKPTPNTPPK